MSVVNDMNATMQQVQSSSEELMTTAAELQETLEGFVCNVKKYMYSYSQKTGDMLKNQIRKHRRK